MKAPLQPGKSFGSAVSPSTAQLKGGLKTIPDNRPTMVAQRKLQSVVQGKFHLNGSLLGHRHLGGIGRWIVRYREDKYAAFQAQMNNEDIATAVDIDEWLQRNVGESYSVLSKSDIAWEDAMDMEHAESELFGGPLTPCSTTLAYGEESGRGALAELRKNPHMSRRGSRYVTTTPGGSFPSDEESVRVRQEIEARGGETLTNVDVRASFYDEDTTLPLTSNVVFRYPRTNRGTNPSTADVTSAFLERVAEVGGGDLAIPRADMYSNGQRNKLYGSNRFEATMKNRHLSIESNRPGPEHNSELGGFGYSHRQTDKQSERQGGVNGKTMVIRPHSGNSNANTSMGD